MGSKKRQESESSSSTSSDTDSSSSSDSSEAQQSKRRKCLKNKRHSTSDSETKKKSSKRKPQKSQNKKRDSSTSENEDEKPAPKKDKAKPEPKVNEVREERHSKRKRTPSPENRDPKPKEDKRNRDDKDKDRYVARNSRDGRHPDRSRTRREDHEWDRHQRHDRRDERNYRNRYDDNKNYSDRNRGRPNNNRNGRDNYRRRRSRSRSFDHTNAKWGKDTDDHKKSDKKEPGEKQKPNFGLSGKLTEETNTYKGVVIKYSEPPEARKPKRRWRLYPFKGEKALQTLYIHRESAYLIGRDRKVVDLPVDHPSCSKQHAALQYRLVPFTRDDGSSGKRVRPYLIDLESANGTYINNKKIEPKKYVELLEKDVIKFGYSSREYVLLHENSKDEAQDDDVKQEPEETVVKEEPE